LILSAAIGLLAYRRGSLSRSGVVGAVLIGTSIFGFGGWVWGGTLIAFFVSSSLLSHYGASRKALLREKFAKDSRRDLAQTLANGGLAALVAVVAGLVGRTAPIFPLLALGFYGALAAANADTWATELGVLAKQPPRLITTGKVVPTGTSGGVTWRGMAAALVFILGCFGAEFLEYVRRDDCLAGRVEAVLSAKLFNLYELQIECFEQVFIMIQVILQVGVLTGLVIAPFHHTVH
jgi:uncharacterized protein (TIGR00297 family)